ncbi:MAG: lipopolysaccharide biosynthesis protein, partial [Peptococcaceae bacterium]
LNQSDRIMINYFAGSGKAGIYSVAYSAASIMLLLVSAINGSFNPWMYRKLKTEHYRDVGDTAVTICLIVAAATLAISAFAPDLIALLATADYQEAIWIVPPVAASVFFIFVYMVFANVEMYYGENRYIAVISIVCSAANVILNAIFIPLFGYLAAGWTTLVCYVLLAVLHYILMKRACRINQVAPIFREKTMLLIALIVLALSFVMLGLYPLGYFRYAALAMALAVLFCLRRRVAAALKSLRQ